MPGTGPGAPGLFHQCCLGKEPGRPTLPSPRTLKPQCHPVGREGSGGLGLKFSAPGKLVHLKAPVGCGLGEGALILDPGF